MISALKKCPLFYGMTDIEIGDCVEKSGAVSSIYEKDTFIFKQNDEPIYMLILLEGAVAICNDTSSGKRSIIAVFDEPGELFGEVFLFLRRREYDHYAKAVKDSRVLLIPKNYFFSDDKAEYFNKLLSNMMSIFAQKAYYLNQRLQILSCSTLRQKISKILLQNVLPDGKVSLNMNREELADFLNTARPSLSRELMRMQEENLIKLKNKDIYIQDIDFLKNIL